MKKRKTYILVLLAVVAVTAVFIAVLILYITRNREEKKDEQANAEQHDRENEIEVEKLRTLNMAKATAQIEFIGEFEFEQKIAADLLLNAYAKQYVNLQRKFNVSPAKVNVTIYADVEEYRAIVNKEVPAELHNGSTVGDLNSNPRIAIYMGKIDNLGGIGKTIVPILEHELVHVFQITKRGDEDLSQLPLWYVEGQAEYYANPLKYGNYDISRYSTLADLEKSFTTKRDTDTPSNENYAISKVFYEKLIAKYGEGEMLNWLEGDKLQEISADLSEQYKTSLSFSN